RSVRWGTNAPSRSLADGRGVNPAGLLPGHGHHDRGDLVWRPGIRVIPRRREGDAALATDMSTAVWTVMALRAATGEGPEAGVAARGRGWRGPHAGLPARTGVLGAVAPREELVRRPRSGPVARRDAKTEASLMAWSAAHGRPVPATPRPPRRRHRVRTRGGAS